MNKLILGELAVVDGQALPVGERDNAAIEDEGELVIPRTMGWRPIHAEKPELIGTKTNFFLQLTP